MNAIIEFLDKNPDLAVCLGRLKRTGALRLKMIDLTTGADDRQCEAVSQIVPWATVASVKDDAFDSLPELLTAMRTRLQTQKAKGHHNDKKAPHLR